MKTAVVLGASGFIGNHLINDLKEKGFYVIGIDIQSLPDYAYQPDEFILGDLREAQTFQLIKADKIDRVYQLAANMGGADYIFVGENDLEILQDNMLIQIQVSKWLMKANVDKIFFSSSACIYPLGIQQLDGDFSLKESDAFPAEPDSVYGWEKLVAELLYQSLAKKTGLKVYIARFHNIYGPHSVWQGGREKAPAAIARKVAMAKEGETIQIYGSGQQIRTFLYIEDCLEAVELLLNSDFHEVLNIGSEEIISIYDLAKMTIDIAGKDLKIETTDGPVGVDARSSNNDLIKKVLHWEAKIPLRKGMEKLYHWVLKQTNND